MKYLIVGDIHGDWYSFVNGIKYIKERSIDFDAVIQVGDFGMYERNIKQLFVLLEKEPFEVPVHFIDGNHEDHRYVAKHSRKRFAKYNLFYHPRSTITILDDGTKIGWLGGAFNVERHQEIHEIANDRHVANFVLTEDVKIAIDNIERAGGVDLMVTHTCPSNIGVGMCGNPMFNKLFPKFIGKLGFKMAPDTDSGDEPLEKFWNELDPMLRPKTWVFGHYHYHHASTVDNTDFYCVGSGDMSDRLQRIIPYIYDTEIKAILH